MLEESSKQGCLNSSYLLWESNRKAAVSRTFFFSQNHLFTVTAGPLMRREHTQKEIGVPQLSLPS